MAEVFHATNRFTEKDVAIKLLSKEFAEKEPEAKQRFLNEAKVSARVDHPNIVDVIDVGQTEEGHLFLVMELLTGVSLETALQRQSPRMSFSELGRVMLDIAAALEAAHSAGVVHRDLKPSNIFLHKTRKGVRPTLLDFGVAKFLQPSENDPTITLAGTVLGSPLYMSPEQARGQMAVDGRADIFAFGGILFEAATGQRAYDAANFNALIVKIATARPKSIDKVAPSLPDSFRKVIRACLEPVIDRRAQTFGQVRRLLAAALPSLSKSPLPRAIVPAALVDPDATNAMPVFSDPQTRYDSELAVRETPPPSPLWVIGGSAVLIAILAVVASQRETPPLPVIAAPPPVITELVVTASTSCSVAIDGTERGSTPATVREVTPGDHEVTCRTSNGIVRTAKVTVGAGTSTKYRFLLDGL
jgi:serine/threonine-protein kinase